jgi:hypothetical protein
MKELMTCMVVFCFFSLSSLAQTNLRSADIRSIGTGGNGVTNSVLSNPGCLSLSTTQFIDINYFNKYELKELSSVSLVYGHPDLALPFAVHISTFGYNKYRETMFRLALSKRLSSAWFIGVSMQYALLQTELYEEEAKKISTDVGILFIPDKNLLIGLSITDLPSTRLDNKNINIEDFNYYSVQSGFQWKYINNLLITMSANYNNHSTFHFNVGLEYTAYDHFFIRTGLQTNPVVPAFGAGIAVASFRLDVAANYHTLLGVCSGVGLSYSF